MIEPKFSVVFPLELENAGRNERWMEKYLRDFRRRLCSTERGWEMFEIGHNWHQHVNGTSTTCCTIWRPARTPP